MTRMLAYAPAGLWAAVLLFLGSRSQLPGPPWPLHFDKLLHFGAHALLGALAAGGWWRRGARDSAPLVIVLALLVGVTDELLQRATPGRHAELADWIADALGVIAGFGLVAWSARRYTNGER